MFYGGFFCVNCIMLYVEKLYLNYFFKGKEMNFFVLVGDDWVF